MKVGLNVWHRLDYFSKLIEKHKATLDDPERDVDLMYEFLEQQRRDLQQGKTNTVFTGITFLLGIIFPLPSVFQERRRRNTSLEHFIDFFVCFLWWEQEVMTGFFLVLSSSSLPSNQNYIPALLVFLIG